MLPVKLAMQQTTCHGPPRMVTNKPIYVRITWLLFFILMFCLFARGFYEFVMKLQSRQVTNSLKANSVKFQFPDIYACFYNPISASYSATIDNKSAVHINKVLDSIESSIYQGLRTRFNASDDFSRYVASSISYMYPQSLPYNMLVNVLSHRMEQAIIDSYAVYKDKQSSPIMAPINPEMFYEPLFLSCMKWKLDDTTQEQMLNSRTSSGLFVSLLVDADFPNKSKGFYNSVRKIYFEDTLIQLSEWSMSFNDIFTPDRRSGVRVFLTPPGEYPSDFVTTFSLSPGKYHTVEMSMTSQLMAEGQFDCLSDQPGVQFVNPYSQTPYNHSYSYSYCYYYEYHSRHQAATNTSGDISPLPWPLRNRLHFTNLSVDIGIFFSDSYNQLSQISDKVLEACEKKRPCSTLHYSASISSTDWPTHSSISPFISSNVKNKWTTAKSANLSVPALDFLMTANESSVSSYLRSNMLKVHFKPHRVLCDEVTFSIDYNIQNFISDIGGIMGIYLGMSLLTMCELLELIYDLLAGLKSKGKTSQSTEKVATNAA